MKVLAIILTLVAVSSCSTIPLVPGDNSHYVEGESRYIWMTGKDDKPVLVDLQAEVDDQVLLSARNGAENQYWLFTRQNPTNHQILVNGNINSVWNSNYRANRPTKVLVHGWNNNGNSNMNPLITAAFLAVADVNVIVLDWNRLANSLYNVAVRGVPDVGNHLGWFLIWLFNNAGGNWNQLHLVGFSLGAHVVGNAGRTIGGRAARVTGLDPAGPQWGGNSFALNTNSGQYVESIHTDGRILGIMDPISHADFYPNGGRNMQPGCLTSLCSHGRSTEYFASSVRTNHFIGRQCNNLNEAQLSSCTGAQLRMGNGDLSKRGAKHVHMKYNTTKSDGSKDAKIETQTLCKIIHYYKKGAVAQECDYNRQLWLRLTVGWGLFSLRTGNSWPF